MTSVAAAYMAERAENTGKSPRAKTKRPTFQDVSAGARQAADKSNSAGRKRAQEAETAKLYGADSSGQHREFSNQQISTWM